MYILAVTFDLASDCMCSYGVMKYPELSNGEHNVLICVVIKMPYVGRERCDKRPHEYPYTIHLQL